MIFVVLAIKNEILSMWPIRIFIIC